MRIKLKGKTYTVRFVPNLGCWGDVSHPEEPRPQIRLRSNMRPKVEMDTTLHEGLHILYPELSEEAVLAAAKDLTELMWKLGYRRKKE